MLNEEELTKFKDDYSNLKDSEKDTFSRLINKLLNKTFIIRSLDYDRSDYYESHQWYDLLSAYLKIIDYDLIEDTNNGVIYVKTLNDKNRARLNKLETIILLILRLKYYEKSKQISLENAIYVKVDEIQKEVDKTQIYSAIKSKNEYFDALKNLRRYKLIDFTTRDFNPDTNIKLLPTIRIVIDINNEENIKALIKGFKGDVEGEDDEETY